MMPPAKLRDLRRRQLDVWPVGAHANWSIPQSATTGKPIVAKLKPTFTLVSRLKILIGQPDRCWSSHWPCRQPAPLAQQGQDERVKPFGRVAQINFESKKEKIVGFRTIKSPSRTIKMRHKPNMEFGFWSCRTGAIWATRPFKRTLFQGATIRFCSSTSAML
jgi:hypothetical protein